ncbi:DNA topoisomerase IV, alpha subunit, partial [Cylindrobasidium torrendii FP15055 ss-10]
LAQLFRVLEFSHEACVNEIPATKRDIYYKDVPLFQQQRVVDNLVDDLAATFDIDRAELNIRATSKGLICGPKLTISLKNGTILSPTDADPILIPVQEDIDSLRDYESLCWVLIVEKDAIFQHLCHLKLTTHPLLPGTGVLITGKGYPDLATRHLVKTLSDLLPDSVPILALVDGDAYGIDILSVYQNGSRALRHQADALAAKRIRWLGLYASELVQMNIDQEALIPMSEHDEKKAKTMLRDRPDMPPMWRRELLDMLESRRKAEIEILYSVSQTDEGSSALLSHHSPLLEYLARKITVAVKTASTSHAVF